jgi:hypothetical protein
MKRGGGSLRGEHIRNSQNLLGETFADDASLTLGIYMWRLGLLEKESYKHENTIDIGALSCMLGFMIMMILDITLS